MSEIARLRKQIELECEAMRLALHGYAAVASHKAIEQKYNSLGQHHEALEQLVGRGGEQHHCRDLFEGCGVGLLPILVYFRYHRGQR